MSKDSKETNFYFIGFILYIFLILIVNLYKCSKSPTGRGISRSILKNQKKNQYERKLYHEWVNGERIIKHNDKYD